MRAGVLNSSPDRAAACVATQTRNIVLFAPWPEPERIRTTRARKMKSIDLDEFCGRSADVRYRDPISVLGKGAVTYDDSDKSVLKALNAPALQPSTCLQSFRESAPLRYGFAPELEVGKNGLTEFRGARVFSNLRLQRAVHDDLGQGLRGYITNDFGHVAPQNLI